MKKKILTLIPQDGCSSTFYDCVLVDDGAAWDFESEECPHGQYFDPEACECDIPENIDGCEEYVTT